MRLPILALLLLTAVRLLVAGLSPLSPDETYYWVWSHALATGYLDHPPMTALWIHAGTLLFGDTPFGARLLSPLAAGLGSLLLASAAADLLAGTGETHVEKEERRRHALTAAILLNATLLFGVGAVTITPDTPLLFFWTAGLAALGRVVATRQPSWWLAVGVAIGLALDSKYTIVLPGAGLALWLVMTPAGRVWLRTTWPWIAGAIAGLLFTPVLAWNAGHGWASFLKQGGRTGDWHPALAGRYLAELVGGQAGLATPLIFVLFVAGMARLSRRPISGAPGRTLLVFVTLPCVLVFIQHALGDRVQANWPSLLYPACAIAASALPWRGGKVVAPIAAASGLLLTGLLYLQSTAAPFDLPRKLDITLMRLAGWKDLATEFAGSDAAGGSGAGSGAGKFGAGKFGAGILMADDYGLASELAFMLPGRGIIAVEPRWRMFRLPHPDLRGQTGLLLRAARRKEAPDPRLFSKSVLLGEIERGRAGRIAESYRIYRVTVRPDVSAEVGNQIVRLPSPQH